MKRNKWSAQLNRFATQKRQTLLTSSNKATVMTRHNTTYNIIIQKGLQQHGRYVSHTTPLPNLFDIFLVVEGTQQRKVDGALNVTRRD